jgi:hypothetical protein
MAAETATCMDCQGEKYRVYAAGGGTNADSAAVAKLRWPSYSV